MAGMRVGYACVNTQLPSASRTLRLANVAVLGQLRTALGRCGAAARRRERRALAPDDVLRLAQPLGLPVVFDVFPPTSWRRRSTASECATSCGGRGRRGATTTAGRRCTS